MSAKLIAWSVIGVLCAAFWVLVLALMGTGWVVLALFFATAVTFTTWCMVLLEESGDGGR